MDIGKVVTGLVLGIVGIVVVFYLVGALSPTLTDASTNISGSGLPLAGLFANGGVVQLLIMVGILIGIIVIAMNIFKNKK